MDLQRQAHKVANDARHMADAVDSIDEDSDAPVSDNTVEATELALALAKRVRRDSTLLVRRLAWRRDNPATAQEGTST